jgi:hypothetical protein
MITVMISRGDEVRLNLFERYSKNLAVYAKVPDGSFRCPICFGQFFRNDVLSVNGPRVDIGHIIPHGAGHASVTLECHSCNNRLNSVADKELVRLFRWQDAWDGDADAKPRCGRVQTAAGYANFEFVNGVAHFHHARSHPDAFAEVMSALQNQTPLKLEVEDVDVHQIDVASIHSAPLLLFSEFG